MIEYYHNFEGVVVFLRNMGMNQTRLDSKRLLVPVTRWVGCRGALLCMWVMQSQLIWLLG
jgi:hypothetical protein